MHEIYISILASLGGSTVVLGGLFGWFGKRYLDKYLELERSQNKEALKRLELSLNKEIESHKTQLKYDEIFFKALYDSSQELYKIRTSLYPEITHPDWDWEDVCFHIATKFEKTESLLTCLLENFYTALPPEIFESLEKAKFLCSDGKLEFKENSDNYSAYDKADKLWDILNKTSVQLKSTIDEKRLVEFTQVFKKT